MYHTWLLQLTRIAPLWTRLKDLLSEHVFSGEEDEDEDLDAPGNAEAADDAIASATAGEPGMDDDDDVTMANSVGAAHSSAAATTAPRVGSFSQSTGGGGNDSSTTTMSQMAELLGDAQHQKTQAMLPFDSEPDFQYAQHDAEVEDGGGGAAVASTISGIVGGSSSSSGARGGVASRPARRRAPGYTWEELLALVQCSPAELRAGLEVLSAAAQLKDDGRYRLLSEDYVAAVLSAIIAECDASAQALSCIAAGDVADALEHVAPVSVTTHVLSMHSSASSSGGGGGGGTAVGGTNPRSGSGALAVSLSFSRVATTLGLRLLRPSDSGRRGASGSSSGGGSLYRDCSRGRMPGVNIGEGWVPLSSFLAEWERVLPPVMVVSVASLLDDGEGAGDFGGGGASAPTFSSSAAALSAAAAPSASSSLASSSAGVGGRSAHTGTVSLSLLAGHILVEDSNVLQTRVVRYFPAAALSDDPATRFRQLFSVRQRWTLGEWGGVAS